MKDLPEHVELVSINEHLHMLDYVGNLLVCHQCNVEAALADLLPAVKDLPEHVELVLIDKHLPLLEHAVNLLVCDKGNEEAALSMMNLS